MKRESARAIIIEYGYIYTIFRKRLTTTGKYKEYYVIPGGGIEKGETAEEAVVRELKEEFTIDIEIIEYLGKTDHEEKYIHHYYLCNIKNGTPKLGGEELEKNSDDNYYEICKIKLTDIHSVDIMAKEFIELANQKIHS